ncbi:MAG TPA: DUF6359 domain-containing protein [Bacteroidales bacterium]|nr:DUF4493 domain-containing protein [Bacteroidales bacterium]MCZ2416280.1 DUF4493 domain-containing protein [Burkholderiales bacterium]OQC56933.1 MAG: hypothetical protein BWX52_01359 [Bacteroidetes bacterium ADurb.Bin013]MBP8998705.1 DUF4493 domain-containing protein [Bacteroidales bacterium]MBV6456482.1 hypothetical protein [Bacteroidales bacterium]
MRSNVMKAAGCILLAAMWACDGLKFVPGPEGFLVVDVAIETPFGVRTKSSSLDSYVFLLIKQGGDTLYNSTVGAITGSPLSLKPGNYTIEVYNEAFTEPAFDKPYYYGMQTAEVIGGESCEVLLICKQENAGIRVLFSEEFSGQYTTFSMNISGTGGSLKFDNTSVSKWGYFFPGTITLTLTADGFPTEPIERTIQAKYMYNFLVEGSGSTKDNVEPVLTLSVDTTHTWISGLWNDTEGTVRGLTKETAYTIAEARNLPGGLSDIWVCGYIVGCYSSGGTYFYSGNESATNLALADTNSEMDKANTYPVELPAGAIRDALNLVDNPQHLSKKIWIRGNTSASYFSLPGLKSAKDYSW